MIYQKKWLVENVSEELTLILNGPRRAIKLCCNTCQICQRIFKPAICISVAENATNMCLMARRNALLTLDPDGNNYILQ